MLASTMNMFGWKSGPKPEATEWMKRYQRLTWMGFPEDEATWSTAQKYSDVQSCVDHLTKDADEHMQNEDTISYGIQSLVNSVFQLMRSGEENASDDEKEEMNENDRATATDVLCKCGANMMLKDAATCYVDTPYLFVICDQCDTKCDDRSKVYHCPKFKIDPHPEGYDICEHCALISNDKMTEIGEIQPENKQIELNHDPNNEAPSKSTVECIDPIHKPQIAKRALIIQTLPNKGSIACQDADALSNLFISLGYQVILIWQNDASRESITDALDTLYASSDPPQETFTIICYSGHGHRDPENGNFVFDEYDEKTKKVTSLYSSHELYKRINVNMDVFPTLKDGFVRMMTGNHQQNETLLIINACYSGALQTPLQQQAETHKSVTIWNNKLSILVFVVAVGVLCYFISKYDKKCETTQATEQCVIIMMESTNPNKATQVIPPAAVEPEMKESADVNGMDKSNELMEREMDGTVDFDWNDLKSDLKGRWSKWRGKVSKKKFVQKYCSALLKNAACDGPDQMPIEPAPMESNPEQIVTEIQMQELDRQAKTEMAYVLQEVLDKPASRDTWKYLARNMSDCAVEKVMSNVGFYSGPASLLIHAGRLFTSCWMRSKKANPSHLVASAQSDQESHFCGGISPFVRSVIDAIGEMEAKNGEILDIEKLYQSVAYDASNQILECGTTLNGMDQHPVIHHTKY